VHHIVKGPIHECKGKGCWGSNTKLASTSGQKRVRVYESLSGLVPCTRTFAPSSCRSARSTTSLGALTFPSISTYTCSKNACGSHGAKHVNNRTHTKRVEHWVLGLHAEGCCVARVSVHRQGGRQEGVVRCAHGGILGGEGRGNTFVTVLTLAPKPLNWAPSPWTFHVPIHFNSNLRFYFHVITVTHSETPVFHPYGDRSLL
jgi:hypothetical protein